MGGRGRFFSSGASGKHGKVVSSSSSGGIEVNTFIDDAKTDRQNYVTELIKKKFEIVTFKSTDVIQESYLIDNLKTIDEVYKFLNKKGIKSLGELKNIKNGTSRNSFLMATGTDTIYFNDNIYKNYDSRKRIIQEVHNAIKNQWFSELKSISKYGPNSVEAQSDMSVYPMVHEMGHVCISKLYLGCL